MSGVILDRSHVFRIFEILRQNAFLRTQGFLNALQIDKTGLSVVHPAALARA